MKYIPIIGMEVHAELKTKSKMFCDCENGFGLEKEPNVHVCPVCTGQPGSLPVINKKAVEMVIKTGLALNCQIADDSFFERKNYFYPDLPKGYQISQYQKPLCFEGWLDLSPKNENVILAEAEIQNGKKIDVDSRLRGNDKKGNGNYKVRIGITRIHLEEDTGKLLHPKGADYNEQDARYIGRTARYSLVDFNRAGVPLMELVTEPDIRSGVEAKKFCQELQLILRYLGVSDADMEKGQMRCEVNISLREIAELRGTDVRNHAEKKFGTKVEIKNLNSFKVVEKAIDYEIKRQAEVLESGRKVIQETRGWDDNKGETYSQRTKEEAHDYRYFPEPDLPPLRELSTISNQLKTEIPELPAQKRVRFLKEYNLPGNDVESFVSDLELSEYFEEVCSELTKTEYSDFVCHSEVRQPAGRRISSGVTRSFADAQDDKNNNAQEIRKLYKLTANYLLTEIPRIADRLQVGEYKLPEKITAENFAEFVVLIHQGKISSSGAQKVLEEMFITGVDPSHIIETGDLAQISDESELEKIAEEAIKENPQPVADYKKGKEASLQFLVGQVMKKSKGKANPQVAGEILKKKLAS